MSTRRRGAPDFDPDHTPRVLPLRNSAWLEPSRWIRIPRATRCTIRAAPVSPRPSPPTSVELSAPSKAGRTQRFDGFTGERAASVNFGGSFGYGRCADALQRRFICFCCCVHVPRNLRGVGRAARETLRAGHHDVKPGPAGQSENSESIVHRHVPECITRPMRNHA